MSTTNFLCLDGLLIFFSIGVQTQSFSTFLSHSLLLLSPSLSPPPFSLTLTLSLLILLLSPSLSLSSSVPPFVLLFLPFSPSLPLFLFYFFFFLRSQQFLKLSRPSSSLTQNGRFFGEKNGRDQKNHGRWGACIHWITFSYILRFDKPLSLAFSSSRDYEDRFCFISFIIISLLISISCEVMK